VWTFQNSGPSQLRRSPPGGNELAGKRGGNRHTREPHASVGIRTDSGVPVVRQDRAGTGGLVRALVRLAGKTSRPQGNCSCSCPSEDKLDQVAAATLRRGARSPTTTI